jgi:hypothetical protein
VGDLELLDLGEPAGAQRRDRSLVVRDPVHQDRPLALEVPDCRICGPAALGRSAATVVSRPRTFHSSSAPSTR